MSSSARYCGGFTLAEMLIAIVVIGVGLGGVLLAFQITARGSADPLVQRQLQAVAEGLLEEVLSKPFTPQAGAGAGGCARDGFNDVDDYHGYTSSGVCEINGSAVPGLGGYAVNVQVLASTLAGVATKRIQVTVSRGSDSLQLAAHRSGWGS
ncbi:MAG: prepilin-type N-terminal cleavage/methylation domain-containing protein [Burkholderiales bacterium]|uniref:prepilin-type N-terminal cleavage/methylation domain-containing protein n=1 Tax=Inhella sp. TaxID=1921806 RepID=UPI001AC897BB|nr:prepilin-type N-terminal cleavage/methylation domain-containing protein [Burkholderiales bacterium]